MQPIAAMSPKSKPAASRPGGVRYQVRFDTFRTPLGDPEAPETTTHYRGGVSRQFFAIPSSPRSDVPARTEHASIRELNRFAKFVTAFRGPLHLLGEPSLRSV